MTSQLTELNLAPWQISALTSESRHHAMLGGVAIGKSFTGAHFVIYHITHFPTLTGFVGANTHDQLSQVTLRELMYWLDHLGFEYVIGRMPPLDWGQARKFKTYDNILSVRTGKHVVTIFTRVLSHGDNLRGLQFSWYWIDETRDTPLNTHDVILSRLREGKYIKGLVTTTPSGEDWVWRRFVVEADGATYSSSHTPTRESVRYGIISMEFYMDMRKSYSPNMAAQELDAKHVTLLEGRVYYTCDEGNKEFGFEPDVTQPLIIGMDFNFQPAPMCWCVGQYDIMAEKMHWFDELSGVEMSSTEMARRLASRYGDYHLQIFGDASGNRGTTSNAGVTDFMMVANALNEAEVSFTLDTDQCNPAVRDRTENMARLFCDANGDQHMFIDPNRCPLLWGDTQKVVWKNGKLAVDKGVEHPEQYTHCSDGAGYAMWKICPLTTGNARIGEHVGSQMAQMGNAL